MESFIFSTKDVKIDRKNPLGVGFGGNKVYPAENPVSGKKYAIKIMRDVEETKILKIEEEIKILTALLHPNFIKFEGYEKKVDKDEGTTDYYFVMERAQDDLQKILDNPQKREIFKSLKAIHTFIYHMLSICEHFRSKNICHRDIKTSNILLCEGDMWKLADTGFAKMMSDSANASRSTVGTLSFMAPELQLGTRPNNEHFNWYKSDVYSLGLVFLRVCGYNDPDSLNSYYDNDLPQKIMTAIAEAEKIHKDPFISRLLTSMLTKSPENRLNFEQLWKMINDNPLSTLVQVAPVDHTQCIRDKAELEQKFRLLETRVGTLETEKNQHLKIIEEKNKEIENLSKLKEEQPKNDSIISMENELSAKISERDSKINQILTNGETTQQTYFRIIEELENDKKSMEAVHLSDLTLLNEKNSELEAKLATRDEQIAVYVAKMVNFEKELETKTTEVNNLKRQLPSPINVLDRIPEIDGAGSCEFKWNHNKAGTGIKITDNDKSIYLEDNVANFRTVLAKTALWEGIYYWEITVDPRTTCSIKIGVAAKDEINVVTNECFSDKEWGFALFGEGELRHGNNSSGSVYGKPFKTAGVIGCFLNMISGKLSFTVNGEYFGVAYTDARLTQGPIYPAIALMKQAGCKLKTGIGAPEIFLCNL
jgi:serine/threonine protein kinase